MEHDRVSAEGFLEWVLSQEGRFELVDGYVIEIMAGAKQGHNVVVSNIVSSLGPQSKSSGCRTTSSNTAFPTLASTIRYPDIVVDCGPPDPDAMVAESPTLVVEVSSPGTSLVDTTDKLDEYREHPTVRLIMFVEPNSVLVKLYRRDSEGTWGSEKYDDLASVIGLPEIGASLALSEIYDTLMPRNRPCLHLIEKINGQKPR
ncbi:Uma2 family endonuclease [Endobacterium cereale]|uniref:Uma2 family endonuclease n=1 Tax=Endobacterium cereale TaxID=2663029 RepID=UPI002B464296|nr:Uma2 family endonuclease [Endobacterium cereale]MEB2845983.1 Uma2 family endonuclease [Endobacterium cereale]